MGGSEARGCGEKQQWGTKQSIGEGGDVLCHATIATQHICVQFSFLAIFRCFCNIGSMSLTGRSHDTESNRYTTQNSYPERMVTGRYGADPRRHIRLEALPKDLAGKHLFSILPLQTTPRRYLLHVLKKIFSSLGTLLDNNGICFANAACNARPRPA